LVQSDRLYNAGWTEDLRTIIHYVHEKYPRAPLFTIGTSIGANILVIANHPTSFLLHLLSRTCSHEFVIFISFANWSNAMFRIARCILLKLLLNWVIWQQISWWEIISLVWCTLRSFWEYCAGEVPGRGGCSYTCWCRSCCLFSLGSCGMSRFTVILKEIGSIGIACDWMLVVIGIVWCLLSFWCAWWRRWQVCDRFMSRKTIQKIYNMVLATGLRQYANMYLT
jgi:hypothetical protein